LSTGLESGRWRFWKLNHDPSTFGVLQTSLQEEVEKTTDPLGGWMDRDVLGKRFRKRHLEEAKSSPRSETTSKPTDRTERGLGNISLIQVERTEPERAPDLKKAA
jgi:hypothetical protein